MRRENGQAAALTVLFLTVLLLSAAAVIDVGSWMREDRDTQRAADAAALAGAQALPEDHATAEALAIEYGTKNGGGVLADDVNFETTVLAGDTIAVDVDRPADSFFSKIIGFDTVEVGSTAKARAGVPSAAQYVAPIVVNINHPQVSCRGRGVPCFDVDADLELANLHGPGSGGRCGCVRASSTCTAGGSGSPGSDELASWMAEGFNGLMEPGIYHSAPSDAVQLEPHDERVEAAPGRRGAVPDLRPAHPGQRLERALQHPRLDRLLHRGLRQSRVDRSSSKGYFTRVVWKGVLSNTATTPNFGVRTVALID